MRTLHRILAVVTLVASVGVLSARQASSLLPPLPAARDVVSRSVSAMGGVEAYKALKSVHGRGKFEISGLGLTGEFNLYLARPNRFLLRMNIPGLGAIEQAFDGKVGWSVNPASGPEVLSGRELTEAADEAWFDRPLYEPDRVRSLTMIERLRFDGKPAHKIKVVLQSGTESFEFFDVETGLLVGTEAERATPQGVIPIASFFRDHRKFGAFLQPTVYVQRTLGVEQVLTVASYEYNTVPDSAFAIPPEVAALVGK